MDPNHWNTYNLQYGHSAPGGLPPSHPSLNRLDLTSGLGLSHTLQATHGTLGGRSVPGIPAVNYPSLGMPILETMSPVISAQQTHKTMSLAQPQLVFDPPRVTAEQPSPGRYDSSKTFRTESLTRDAMARNQILEAAAARVWGTSNFSPSLYNQFGSLLTDVAPTMTTISSPGPGTGSNSIAASKSNQAQMHEPPPAHSSNVARISSVQRNPHTADLLYRSTEALAPTSFAQISSLYSSGTVSKQNTTNNQQQAVHRQTPVQIPQGYSSHADIEDLSSNSQNQLYGSYANLSVTDSQEFPAAHLSGDMSYEAVSPAPPMSENSQANSEHSSFSIVQFPDLANLTSEHAHTLADKFQENDFRLKMDSRAQQPDALASPQPGQRQDMGASLKVPKDMPNIHPAMLSMQMNQRSGQYQPGMMVSQAMGQSLSQIQPAIMNISHPAPLIQTSQSVSVTTSTMQQSPAPIPVQAMADSTTKPKRSRSRKKKGEPNPPTPASPVGGNKKSSNPQASAQQISQPSPHILNMPPTSPHISTLPMGSHGNLSSQIQQQQQPQQGYSNSGSNQFTSRDAHRAQTPSMPQNYSMQDHHGHGYTPAQSPKAPVTPNQNVMTPQGEFALPGRVPNDKSSSSYKQQQRKSSESSSKSNNSQSNQMYRSNIPDNQQQHMQNFATHSGLMGNSGQQRGSPMQDNRGGMGRMQNFSEQSPQQKMVSQMSPLGQPSPQGNVGTDNFSANKMNSSNHMMGSGVIGTQPPVSMSQSPMDSRPVSVEPTAMTHAYEQGHQPTMIDAQDSGQFQLDLSSQPFLEQLVGVQPPMAVPSASFSHTNVENGEVVFTTLVTPAESARLQQQQHDLTSTDGSFRPTYHGEAVHEIRPIGHIGGHLGMEDVSFNAFFDNQREMDQQNPASMQQQQGSQQQASQEPEKMSLTYVPHVIEDDELSDFSQPVMNQPVVMIKKEPQDPNDPRPKHPSKDSFQDSFLSYLQGHKQETLSSVSSSAVTKKPQLPKYIPEPRRPRPVPPPKENLNFSDAEDGMVAVNSKVKDLISNLSDNDNSSQKSESDKEGYSVQRTSELAVKITLPKNKKKNKFGPFAESSLLKDSMRKNREGMLKRRKRKGKHKDSEGEEYVPGTVSEEEATMQVDQLVPREPSPVQMRTSIGRKAKDKCLEKTKKRRKNSGSEGSSDEIVKPFIPNSKINYKSDDSDKNYDSDKDPIWMPFEVDLKQGHEFDEKRKKVKRPRVRLPSIKSKPNQMHKTSSSSTPRVNNPTNVPSTTNPHKPAASTSTAVVGGGDATTAVAWSSSESKTGKENLFKPGMYVIEKKDKHNYESYPIWRLEAGNMIRKFEFKLQDGAVRHQAVGTFSTWMPSMESQFEPLKVKEAPLQVKGEPLTVEVLEECRPKPPTDGRLEIQYEDDPLVEPFNVYLQVFLSQALEPNFLSAILETNEKFYVDALNQIDNMIEVKCLEICRLAQWKASFKECLHRCPLMKEIDRPNLKQPCQASENSSPPTIKSVLLSGQPYNRFLLTEQPALGSDIAQEFMIGKVAAYYVRTYHSLYHFKYWLRQRCDAKVKMMKESNKCENLSDEHILDKCLENRSWVLQLFDSLKSMLKYGGEAPR